MDSKRYMISDAAKLVDVESHVLRYWEDELELPISRNEMGHRYYTEDDIRTFHQIKELKEQGCQLKAIKTILSGKETEAVSPMVVKEAEPMGNKLELFQQILGKAVAQAIRENQQEMGRELSHQVSTQVVKEMDYLFRLQEEREETHFKKLDEALRDKQKKHFALHAKKEAKPKVSKVKKVKEPRTRGWFPARAKKDVVL